MSFKETEIGKLPNHWEVKSLSDVTKIQNGYAFKSKYFLDEGNPVIKIKNVNGRVVDTNDCQLYPHELCKGLDKFIINNNDILIAMTGAGSVGRISKFTLKNKRTYYLNQRVGKIQPVQEMVDNEFLFQIISTVKYESVLYDLANGSGQPNLSPNTIGLVKIPCPPIDEQKSIAHILSTLDKKIEVNNQINKTLENMAQAIFKQWFVDFEFPNEDGEPYKSSGGEMVESELGMIPKGWEVVDMSDICEVRDGTHDSPKAVDVGYYLITSKHLKNNYIEFSDAKYISENDYHKVNERSKVDRYDILITMIGTVGNIYLVQDEKINFAIKNVGLFKTSTNQNYYDFIYLLLKSKEMQQYIEQRLAGSTQKYISLTELRKIPFIIPTKAILKRFKEVSNPILDMIYYNEKENSRLKSIRDSLLPKLMSGEIRVPLDSERDAS